MIATLVPPTPGAGDGIVVGVAVRGTGVLVGGIVVGVLLGAGVAVGGTGVSADTGVGVGSTGVDVAVVGIDVFVGSSVAVGGTDVAVGGIGVGVTGSSVGVGSSVAVISTSATFVEGPFSALGIQPLKVSKAPMAAATICIARLFGFIFSSSLSKQRELKKAQLYRKEA